MDKFFIEGSNSSKPRGRTRTCPACGKVFSSGRAFGGHWRYHLQQDSRRGEKHSFFQRTGDKFKAKARGGKRSFTAATTMNTTAMRNDDEDQDRYDKTIYCCVCNKTFFSLRSLSGHMRSHPERVWRGIQPPAAPPPNRMSSSSSEDARNQDHWSEIEISPVDLLEHFPWSWSKTGKRGRKSSAVAAAVDGLIDLSRGRESSRKFEKSIADPSPLTSEDRIAKQLKIKSVSGKGTLLRISHTYDHQEKEDTKDMKGKKVIIIDSDVREKKGKNMCLGEKKRNFKSSSSTETDENVSLLGSTASKTTKKIDNVTTTNWYKCSSCEKSFSTFQALGGHRSIHTKKIISTTPKMAEKEISTTNASDLITGSTTQLADHSSPEITMSSSGFGIRGGQSGRTLLDFDLNELPFGMA
ncbi:Zinc finger protein ZAT2 [Morus notabilis]|uniref:Zinc finger protein ZAT2 n=1 Tax=Morus notabilis TaxID=981085 RepID=W9RGX4_9ROSA|nr:Zinc finger protein ZAT2 [Morus notabilis]